MMYLSKNFKEEEFICKCGKCKEVPADLKENLILLCQQLERIRFYTGAIIINSGVRCVSHNKKVGGVANSQHLYGRAADIRSEYVASKDLYKRILVLMEMEVIKIGYVKYYEDKKFVHIDVRGFI